MINPIPELTPLLKQLRLSGMTESLANRNREAIEHQLSYPEFLALLVQDEVARREQKKYAMRIRRAGFRINKTLESFDLDFNPKLNRAQLKELASCSFIEEKVAVLIAGPSGTGKSHLAQALGHCAVQKGHDVFYHTQAKLLGYLHAARATDTYQRRLHALAKVPLLIIDDFGLQPLSHDVKLAILQILEDRYAKNATIIASQLPIKSWYQYLEDATIADAIMDRLTAKASRIELKGKSLRTRLTDGQESS